jgi:Uncharacterized conserved protein
MNTSEKFNLDYIEELSKILVCPKCGKDIFLKEPDKDKLICNNCRLIYNISEDIPKMLIEEAETF